MCVSLHVKESQCVQVNETKLHLKLIALSTFINANCLGGFLLCLNHWLVFAFRPECAVQSKRDTLHLSTAVI